MSTPLLIVVDGVAGAGKTTVITSAMRGLTAAGVRVLHKQWLDPSSNTDSIKKFDHAYDQAVALDASLDDKAKRYDVIICDTHPCITLPINNTNAARGQKLWQPLYKPDFVLLLSCNVSNAIKRKGSINHHLFFKKSDLYDGLTSADIGTTHYTRASTNDSLQMLFAAGDLRSEIMRLLGQRKMECA